jgi:hypothetical protein
MNGQKDLVNFKVIIIMYLYVIMNLNSYKIKVMKNKFLNKFSNNNKMKILIV